MDSPLRTLSTRRHVKLLMWSTVPVLALAGLVQITGVGIDILLVAAVGLLLLALERSVGDWLGELVGPFAAAAIFGGIVVVLSWYFLSSPTGRAQTDRLFVEAERRGYQTIYYTVTRANESPSGQSSATAQPVATGGNGAVRAPHSGTHPGRRVTPTSRADSTQRAAAGGAAPVGSSAQPNHSRGLQSFFRRSDSAAKETPTTVSINVDPATGQVARTTVITAVVHAGTVPVTEGTVAFTVNGQGAGRIPLTASGSASTTFVPNLAGVYEVFARYSGSTQYSGSSSAPIALKVVSPR